MMNNKIERSDPLPKEFKNPPGTLPRQFSRPPGTLPDTFRNPPGTLPDQFSKPYPAPLKRNTK